MAATKAQRGPSFTAAAGKAAAKRADGTKKKAVQQGHSKRWLFGPYWLSSGLTLLSWVSHRVSEHARPGHGLLGILPPAYRGSAILSLLLLVAAGVVALCQHNGHPLGSIDRQEEVVYVSACLTAAAGWSVAVGMGGLWPAAAGTAAAAACASSYWIINVRLRLPRWAAGTMAGLVLAFVLYLLDPLRPRAAFGHWLGAWALATTVCSAPWWTHRGVRRGMSVDKSIGAWRVAAEAAGHEGIRVVPGSVEALPHGWRAKVALPDGQTWEDLSNTVKKQESLAGIRRGALSVSPDPAEMAHRALVQCVETDVHREPQDWPGPVARSIGDPLPIGPRGDGGVATVRWWEPEGAKNGLAAGMRGSGKSTLLNTTLGGLAACLDVVTLGVDLKGKGIEFGPWRDAMGALATDLATTRGMFVAMLAITKARGELLTERGPDRKTFRRTWVPGPSWADGSEVNGRPEDGPFVLLIIDEAHECLGIDPICADFALRLAQLSRFAAAGMIVCTQRPAMDSIGHAALRGQLDLGFVLGFKTPQNASFAIEGYEDYNLQPWNPAWRKRRGTLYVLGADDEKDSLTARVYQMAEEQIDFIAAKRAELGVRLDPATANYALAAIAEVLSDGDFRLSEAEVAEIGAAATAIIRQAAGLDAEPATAGAARRHPATARPGPAPASMAARQHTAPRAAAPATPEVPMTDDLNIDDATLQRLLDAPLPAGFQVPAPVEPDSIARTPVGDVPRMSSSRALSVLAELAARPDGVSPREVMEATGFKSSWTDHNLRDLVADGKLVKDGHGRYRVNPALQQAADAPQGP